MFCKANDSDLCFGVLSLILVCLGSSVRGNWGTDLITSQVLIQCPLTPLPKARGRPRTVITLPWKCVQVKILAGLCDIFTADSECPINSMLMQSRKHFVSPPQPAAKQSNTFKILQNSFHFKALIRGLARLHWPVF